MAEDDNSELATEDPEPSVIERVAQALEDKDTGEARTIVRDTANAAPLLPRRGNCPTRSVPLRAAPPIHHLTADRPYPGLSA
jgi:hypothetical protein